MLTAQSLSPEVNQSFDLLDTIAAMSEIKTAPHRPQRSDGEQSRERAPVPERDDNRAFVERATSGFDEYRAAIEPYTLEEGERLTGVPAQAIREACIGRDTGAEKDSRRGIVGSGVSTPGAMGRRPRGSLRRRLEAGCRR